MPIYVYACPRCGDTVEKIRPVSKRDEPLVCEERRHGGQVFRHRIPTAPSGFQVHGFSAVNGYAGERTFEKVHTTGKLKGIRTKVTGRPEGFSDGLHK